jgi:hypothetical protein
VHLHFGWRPGIRAAVQLVKLYGYGKTGAPDSAVVAFEMEVLSDTAGLRIDYRGFEARKLRSAQQKNIRRGMDPRFVKAGFEMGVAFGQMPSMLVGPSGEFLALDLGRSAQALTDHAAARWNPAFADTLASFTARVLEIVATEENSEFPFARPDVVRSKVERRWRDAVGDWVGQSLVVGVPLETQTVVPVNGRAVGPLRRIFLVESTAPCPAPRITHTCANAQITTTPGPETVTEFRETLLQEATLDGKAAWSLNRRVRSVTYVITELESLLPHRVEIVHQVETPAGTWADWGRAVWRYTYDEP